MTVPPKDDPAKSARPDLTLDLISDSALRIADAEGLEAVSIRRLARELGVAPMTIYGYVSSKSDLLDAMAGRCLDRFEVPLIASANWRDHVRAIMFALRGLMFAHPGLTRLFTLQRVTSRGLTRSIEATLVHLRAAGLSGPDAVDAFGALFTHTLGSVVFELPRSTRTSDSDVAAAALRLEESVGDSNFRMVLELKTELSTMASERTFELGIDYLLDGIGARVTTSRSRRRGATTR